MEIDSLKLYRLLGCASLFAYVVSILGFTEGAAYQLITVMRKAKEIAALKEALGAQKLSVAKASRIASVLTADNASELIDFASRHTARETDLEVARRSGRVRKSPPKISPAVLEKLKRVQSLMSKKAPVDFEAMLDALADYYIEREDPVKKAERALAKRAKNSERSESRKRSSKTKREQFKAYEVHTVNARDTRRCTHIDINGNRCTNDRWLHIHHIKPVSQGGTNDPANLTTLCAAHHELVHQLSFGIEGQVSWIKAPTMSYH